MEEKILEFVSKLSTAPAAASVARDADLFEEGILDSFGLVDLVTYLEQETGLSITDDDMNDPRFVSVSGMAAVLAGRGAR